MEVIIATKQMKAKILQNNWWKRVSFLLPKAVRQRHIVYMCDQIILGSVRKEKAHRWLGWIQACCCFTFTCTLQESKEINKGA